MVYLQISLNVAASGLPAVAAIHTQFKAIFLAKVKGAIFKEMLIRDEDVQVLHGFDSIENTKSYLSSDLFNQDVVTALKPQLQSPPDVRIYAVA